MERRRKGYHCKGHQNNKHDHGWRDDEYRLVRERRYPVFLRQDLYHVGNDLQQAEGPDPVRSVSVLPEPEKTPLEPDESGSDRHHHTEHPEDGDKWDNDLFHISRPPPYSTCPRQAERRRSGEGLYPWGHRQRLQAETQ